MLFETANQLVVSGCLMASSFALCFLFLFLDKFLKIKKTWALAIVDVFKTLCFCGVFLVINTTLNYGETRFFSIATFLLGILLFFGVKKLVFKLFKKKKES